MKKIFFALLPLSVAACSSPKTTWTSEEISIIFEQPQVMRVLTVDNHEDSLFLRKTSQTFSPEDIRSPEYAELAAKMVSTVTSPEQDGVGIAGPQVGVSRRIVAVMRYDKDGRPFEVFPNIRITDFRGDKAPGPEGCLSVPDMRGDVMRFQDITITYTSPSTLKDTSEVVQGYTAVIFQHECDHLDGILYTDKCI